MIKIILSVMCFGLSFGFELKKNLSDCIITDGTGGMGGDTIVFANYFKQVNISLSYTFKVNKKIKIQNYKL